MPSTGPRATDLPSGPSPAVAVSRSPPASAAPRPSGLPNEPTGPAAGITRICDGPLEGEHPLLECDQAIAAAEQSLGQDAGRVAAAWFRFGIACAPNARCVAPQPNEGHVIVRLGDGPVLAVPVLATATDVETGPATAPTWDIWPRAAPAVETPVPSVDLGPGVSDELAARRPLPFCGSEDDVFDRSVRRCFLDSLVGGVAAEFITAVPAADGRLVRIVHRYEGGGPVLVYRDLTADPAVGTWTTEDCAVETVGDDELIFIVTDCAPLPTT
jgi:hypothetical protein